MTSILVKKENLAETIAHLKTLGITLDAVQDKPDNTVTFVHTLENPNETIAAED
jgi:hypothetical protein